MSETVSTNSVGSESLRSPWVGVVGGGDNGLGGRGTGRGEGRKGEKRLSDGQRRTWKTGNNAIVTNLFA